MASLSTTGMQSTHDEPQVLILNDSDVEAITSPEGLTIPHVLEGPVKIVTARHYP